MARAPSMEVMTRGRRAVVGLLIGVALFLLFQGLRGTQAFERPELALVDVRTNAFIGTRGPDPRILLAVVVEDDLQRMSRLLGYEVSWPWPGEFQAMAADFLRDAGAAVILCDFLYFDRGRALDEVAPDTLAVEGDQIQAELDDVKKLGAALGRFGRTAVGVYVTDEAKWELPGRTKLAEPRSLVPPGENGVPPGTPMRGGVDLPVAAIFEDAALGGFVNVVTDIDGIVRSAYPVSGGGVWMWPSLGLAGASLLTNEPVTITRDGVSLGEIPLPHDEHGRFLMNFRGPPDETYPVVSVYDLVVAGNRMANGEPPTAEDLEVREEVKDKIVVWGASYAGALDVRATPTSGTFLGPEIHATQLDNLLHGDGRVRVDRWINALILALCCLGLGVLGAITRRRFLPHLATLGVMGALVGAAFLLFKGGWSIDLFTPVLACVTTSMASTTFRLLTEGRRNKWLEATFKRYLSPEVIDALKEDPSRLALGGRRRELTILFSDVAGFTSLSEKLEPEQVVLLLNRYLTEQSQELMDQQGVIDKFEGDAIMAFFGDPLDMEDHAAKACRAAVRCMKALPRLEPVWRELGLDGFDIRIGLNSGQALVGNMGSEARFDYTCMGDAVNLASRLEGANKAFGSKIMIGPSTYEEAKEHILAKRLADIVVMGKKEAVRVYELVAMKDDATGAEKGHVTAFNTAVEALLAGDLEAARPALGAAESTRPGDGPTAWMRGLLERMEAGEAPSPWSGRLVLDSK
ncbi:MAG: adenylate/guanylate cyclase domain-containing protein [Planctomycetota bacterium]|nr:adenylate/guanylate cyclase domain-containing protein [Planctomycetota bacterium]